jgi:putative SOS response-associated peptidase YedK
MDWLHERMPVILTDAEAVQRWLDPDVVGEEAIGLLKPIKKSEVTHLRIFSTNRNVLAG